MIEESSTELPPSSLQRTEQEAPPFGDWIRTCRESRRESQRSLAAALNMSPSVLSRIENGSRAPSQDLLRRLAHHWGKDPDQLFLRAGVIPTNLLDRVQADPEGFLAWAAGSVG
ncbi:MAG: helix-turn-helix transcriptional regulator [Myxococcota bacterium]|nr:helix-turn-helix transcriptional regulator [Myxococcota bacterium]